MTRFIPLLAAAAFTAAPLFAQQTSGTITATLDLERHTWHVAGPADPRGSTWQGIDSRQKVRLVGYAEEEPSDDSTPLVLTFTAEGAPTEARSDDLTVELVRANTDQPLKAGPQNTTLTLTALNTMGGEMIVAGSFTAVLTPGGADRIVQTDAEEAVTLDGNFQATLQKAGEDTSAAAE